MKLLFKNIRSGKRQAAITDLNSITRKQIEETLDRKVRPALVKSHELVVANWEHKVKFGARKNISADKIVIYVFPTGENSEIWIFVDQGTKPHKITAKTVRGLRFQGGTYVSKTLARPARTVSGGGYVQNPTWVRKESVNHPGTEARNFSVEIAEDIKPDFLREMENAFKQIAKQVEE